MHRGGHEWQTILSQEYGLRLLVVGHGLRLLLEADRLTVVSFHLHSLAVALGDLLGALERVYARELLLHEELLAAKEFEPLHAKVVVPIGNVVALHARDLSHVALGGSLGVESKAHYDLVELLVRVAHLSHGLILCEAVGKHDVANVLLELLDRSGTPALLLNHVGRRVLQLVLHLAGDTVNVVLVRDANRVVTVHEDQILSRAGNKNACLRNGAGDGALGERAAAALENVVVAVAAKIVKDLPGAIMGLLHVEVAKKSELGLHLIKRLGLLDNVNNLIPLDLDCAFLCL
mmetsp:Transcript_43162/g.126956  ORF Transcript_43162/g.126956 Transcript_43162/m.126956 type:complete len:290 (+) Transcript_43162:255-1124(+)